MVLVQSRSSFLISRRAMFVVGWAECLIRFVCASYPSWSMILSIVNIAKRYEVVVFDQF